MTDGAAPVLVIADTTPLLYLARLGRLELLQAMHRRIVVPRAVWEELTVARPDAPGVRALCDAKWIEVDATADGSPMAVELGRRLDPGESAAIALAVARRETSS